MLKVVLLVVRLCIIFIFKKFVPFFTSFTMSMVLFCIQLYASSLYDWTSTMQRGTSFYMWLIFYFQLNVERKWRRSHRSEDRNNFLYASTCFFLKALEMWKLEILPKSGMIFIFQKISIFSLTYTCWSKAEDDCSFITDAGLHQCGTQSEKSWPLPVWVQARIALT